MTEGITSADLRSAIITLCQDFGFTTERTYELIDEVIDSIREDDEPAVCSHCGEAIREDDNGAGVPIWVHEHGSTVCHDVPAGSVTDGTTATPA